MAKNEAAKKVTFEQMEEGEEPMEESATTSRKDEKGIGEAISKGVVREEQKKRKLQVQDGDDKQEGVVNNGLETDQEIMGRKLTGAESLRKKEVEEERKRIEDEERERRKVDEQKRAEQIKKDEEERKRSEEKKKELEESKRKIEDERKRAEEKKRKDDEESKKKIENERKRGEEKKKKDEEETKLKADTNTEDEPKASTSLAEGFAKTLEDTEAVEGQIRVEMSATMDKQSKEALMRAKWSNLC